MSSRYRLFERFGVELEYMIVDRDSLAIMPVADEVLHAVTGTYAGDADVGALSWSNELVLHVIELKTNGPVPALDGLAEHFLHDIRRMNEILAPRRGQLMPSGMHPWMDPRAETRLWPHDNHEIYETFDRLFDCRAHGWANLQAAHLNLPFGNEEEFGRLHAAIRLILPIMPALSASSPIVDGHPTGVADTRLEVYRSNARRVPSMAGAVIPEPVYTRRDYRRRILEPIYRDLAPLDPQGALQHEWANARGAIARFERNTIEIRVLDMQESPHADLAILIFVVALLRALLDERWTRFTQQRTWPVGPLEDIFLATVRDAGRARLTNEDYLRVFGFDTAPTCTANELCRHLFEAVLAAEQRSAPALAPLRVILDEGCLAHRIERALGPDPSHECQVAVYRELSACLADGRTFHGMR